MDEAALQSSRHSPPIVPLVNYFAVHPTAVLPFPRDYALGSRRSCLRSFFSGSFLILLYGEERDGQPICLGPPPLLMSY
jgi:hypothetical protein